MNNANVHKQSIINKTYTVLIVLLCSLIFNQAAFAKPLKLNDARWKSGWNHPGATTTNSPNRKTVTTVLPAVNSINNDYSIYYELYTNLGNPVPVTVRPLTHTSMVTCQTITPPSNKPIVSSYCTASRYTPTEGMRRLTQPTTVKIELKSPGGGKKFLFWKFIPQGTTASAPVNNPAAAQTQIYDIGPGQIGPFFQKAKNNDYKFRVSIINGYGDDQILGFNPTFVTSGHSNLEIRFGALVPTPVGPPALSLLFEWRGIVRIEMFDGLKTLKPGWTFEHASYKNQRGENCRRKNIRQSKRSNTIYQRFDVDIYLAITPPIPTCSKLYLQRIRLKGPKGMKAEDALRE